jgi:hypothetical protein
VTLLVAKVYTKAVTELYKRPGCAGVLNKTNRYYIATNVLQMEDTLDMTVGLEDLTRTGSNA